jgi:ectoine hydroxylase-related dioxygenase (phytanoyl-CoA dioxygenase family)
MRISEHEQLPGGELLQRFRSMFPAAQSRLGDDLREGFTIGADCSELTREERAAHSRALESILAAVSRDAPFFDEAYAAVVNQGGLPSLPVVGSVRAPGTNGSHHLDSAEAQLFAAFGVLRHRLSFVDPDLYDRVERLLDRLYQELLISSTCAFLFNRDLLELVLNQELVDCVSSLLGDEITFLGCDGPMYQAPGSPVYTQWHSASGRDFGGGNEADGLDHVSCWVAFSDADVERGCMKMAAGSFAANGIKDRLLAPSTWTAKMDRVVATFGEQRYRYRPDYLGKVLARRISYLRHKELHYVDGAGNPGNYNGFHSSIDRDMAMGPQHLDLLDQCEVVALEAKRGDVIMFTSRNTHASFPNRSPYWRKAVAFRYAKTKHVYPSDANNHHDELVDYTSRFPGAQRVFERAGKRVDDFKGSMPRLCIKGAIPKGQEALYFDVDFLRRELSSHDPLA